METINVARPLRVLRLKAVKDKVQRSTSAIYAMMASGEFPRSIKLGCDEKNAAVGWLEHEIDEWLEQQVARRDAGVKS
jgi:prophage regulatory protein